MSEQSFNQPLEDEISLKDIIDFLMESWRTIIVFGLLGLLGSVGFLAITPNQYEALAQIKMAQIPTNKNNNVLGVNVEDPNLLIARLKLPSFYSDREIEACELKDSKLSAESFAKVVKPSSIKGTNSIIEIKILLESKDKAAKCAESLFEKIHESQRGTVEPYINGLRTLVTKYEMRLEQARFLVARADKSGSALSAVYLATRDEIKFLNDEIASLDNLISLTEALQTKLVTPVYASDSIIFPKKTWSLLVGLVIGLIFGLLLEWARKYFQNHQKIYTSKLF